MNDPTIHVHIWSDDTIESGEDPHIDKDAILIDEYDDYVQWSIPLIEFNLDVRLNPSNKAQQIATSIELRLSNDDIIRLYNRITKGVK